MKKALFIILAATFTLISCRKDLNDSPVIPVTGSPKFTATPVTGSVSGVVLDENNDPVSGAMITLANSVYHTDSKGFFITGDHTLDKYISAVKVSKAGYFTTYRSFSAGPTTNYVAIQLIPKIVAGSFSGGSTGNINLSNGSVINFQSNSIIRKSDGMPHTGNVNVYASYIDPSSETAAMSVPGSLLGEDASKAYALRSKGMIAVELESDAGEALQLNPLKPASMKMRIPDLLLNEAVPTIDSWSLDERGVWMKEQTAIRNGSYYDFQASHFTFWSWAEPGGMVFLSANVKDDNGNNMINNLVGVGFASSWVRFLALTDGSGNVSGIVAKDAVLEFEVYSFYHCYPVHEQIIGPYSTDASLNVVVTILPNPNLWTVNGTVTDCSGTPVQNGLIGISYGYQRWYVPFSNGNYTVELLSCLPITSLDLVAIDEITQQQSAPVIVPVTSNTINIPPITACGTSSVQFINYTLDGTNYNINIPALGGSGYGQFYGDPASNKSRLWAYVPTTNNIRITLSMEGASVGTFPVSPVDSMGVNQYDNGHAQPGATATITAYPLLPEGYVEGNFNVPFQSGGAVHVVTGSFRMRKY